MFLADGSRWFLPAIDLGLMIVADELKDELAEGVRLARLVGNLNEITDEYVKYQYHIANIGIRLLINNYEVPREDWEQLLKFQSLKEMIVFCVSVSFVIDQSRRIWEPLVANHSRGLTSHN